MDNAMRDKVWAGGEGYDRYIQAELNSFRKNAWKHQLGQHFPEGASLDILDVGTGPGFFACILSEEGHNVTGIDRSEGMLAHARKNAEALGVSPTFLQMDVNALDFDDETFDAIVLRNVSWTLEHPEKVYTEFRRVLKQGGILLIYDANWHAHFYDEELLKKVRARERRFFEKYGREEIVATENKEYLATCPMTRRHRPDWDKELLTNLGFKVSIHEDVGADVYEEWEKDLYGESPLFEIKAVREVAPEGEQNMHKYWQVRSETFGFSERREDLESIGARFARYLPEGPLKILDVGTGTGIIAASLALLGYDVTGVDLCSNMIEKAKENVASLGLDNIEFYCTSAGDLPFEDDTFDVVVNRNLTWALPEPEKTFLQWRRVLKPRGLLIYQDGNHYYYKHNETALQNREHLKEIRGEYHPSKLAGPDFDYSLCDDTAATMPMAMVYRPYEWDDVVLPKLGFHIIAEEISRPQELLRFEIGKGASTGFMIVAINGKEFLE